MAVRDQERGVVAGYSGPWEQVYRQTNQKIQCGFRPRVGLVSTREGTSDTCGCSFLVPPVQCFKCSYHSAWTKHSDSESARVKGPVFTGKRIQREHCKSECAHRAISSSPIWDTPATRRRSHPYTARTWYRQKDWVPEHSFWTQQRWVHRGMARKGARQGPEASSLVSQGPITNPMTCSCANLYLTPGGSWTAC